MLHFWRDCCTHLLPRQRCPSCPAPQPAGTASCTGQPVTGQQRQRAGRSAAGIRRGGAGGPPLLVTTHTLTLLRLMDVDVRSAAAWLHPSSILYSLALQQLLKAVENNPTLIWCSAGWSRQSRQHRRRGCKAAHMCIKFSIVPSSTLAHSMKHESFFCCKLISCCTGGVLSHLRPERAHPPSCFGTGSFLAKPPAFAVFSLPLCGGRLHCGCAAVLSSMQ